jgi:hypothetical protein
LVYFFKNSDGLVLGTDAERRGEERRGEERRGERAQFNVD